MRATKDIVLITGSSGLIGSALTERLEPDFQVVGFDNSAPTQPVPGTQHITCDFGSDSSIDLALVQLKAGHGERIAAVVHLAAYYDFSGEPSPQYDRITVEGTRRLLSGLQAFQVEQFIFSSTMLVHAPCEPGERISEEWPVEPKWAYPDSKVKTERLLRKQHGRIPIVLLRIAGVYDDACHSIPLANQMQRIRERWLTSGVYPGDTSRGQAFLHLHDLLHAISLLIEKRQQLPRELTLLLGEEETLSYDELQRTFGQLIHGEDWPTRQIPKTLAKTGAWLQDKLPFGDDSFIKPFMVNLADDHYALDTSRARQTLGWEPMHSLRETLPQMVLAMQSDPVNWYQQNKLKAPSDLHEQAQEESHVG